MTAEDMEKGKQNKEEAGAKVTEKFKSTLQNYTQHAEDSKQKLLKLDKFPQKLGQTLLSSGHAISSKTKKRSVLDWAFVELFNTSPNSIGCHSSFVNELPPIDHPALQTKKYGEDLEYIGSLSANTFGIIEKGKWYFKCGRTSGVTAGLCNGTEHVVFPHGQSDKTKPDDRVVRYTKNGEIHNTSLKPSFEFLILSYDNEDYKTIDPHQTVFAEAGDSGSLVIDRLGNICGLLWGSQNGLYNGCIDVGAGLVTSMDDIVDSVAQKGAVVGENGKKILTELFV